MNPTFRSGPQQVDDTITIIAPSLSEVMAEFKARGLAAAGYAITGQAGRQQFALAGAGGAEPLFEGAGMVAATFRRSQEHRIAR